jgi:hypothetical protein
MPGFGFAAIVGSLGFTACHPCVHARIAGGRGLLGHGGIKPECQQATAHERFVIGRPVYGFVGGGWGCSCPPATKLVSQDASLTGFAQ